MIKRNKETGKIFVTTVTPSKKDLPQLNRQHRRSLIYRTRGQRCYYSIVEMCKMLNAARDEGIKRYVVPRVKGKKLSGYNSYLIAEAKRMLKNFKMVEEGA